MIRDDRGAAIQYPRAHDHPALSPVHARGRLGVIHAYHGAHVFPDRSARGEEVYQPLYSVMFEASELWPEAANSPDRVYLDLWEDYLQEAGA